MAHSGYRRGRRTKPISKFTDDELTAALTAASARVAELRATHRRIRAAHADRKSRADPAEAQIKTLEAEARELERRPGARRGLLPTLLTGSRYRPEIRERLRIIHEQIKALRSGLPPNQCTEREYSFTSLDRAFELSSAALGSVEGWLTKLSNERTHREEKAERQRATAERTQAREESKRRRLEELKAAAAANSRVARRLASSTRRKLERSGDCPYCGLVLRDGGHADHIYPLSRGGRSHKSNMVMVCETCNMRKGDMTLREFIKAYNLDRDVIERRLEKLGKVF